MIDDDDDIVDYVKDKVKITPSEIHNSVAIEKDLEHRWDTNVPFNIVENIGEPRTQNSRTYEVKDNLS